MVWDKSGFEGAYVQAAFGARGGLVEKRRGDGFAQKDLDAWRIGRALEALMQRRIFGVGEVL